ncbi:TonB-dependent receptor [Gilvimarinus algae]|uniref:TonB-dependent receptor n=1 Tax=Gilvimarinus algae TaxID=3058037 RepID=A0ABT8THM3_9GAMM|nr:TonB-dependent receptor [Gilvimarinus sp. SDUM040014]MDO3383596.1 TonB-dependent receptor [Gilvimarinus sp. SDUM040014]
MGLNKRAFRRKLIASSISGCLLAPVVAQAQDEPMYEEVVVTGIRASLNDAVDIKRNATGIVDAVSAEDVGKFPDSDVGESLGRIPGVTVGRAFGQGASVSIRGAAPQMTLTQLNGQNVASTGWYDQQSIDRSFNYSLLPSQLIGGIEVYKSSQADLNEGGIGGTVIVKTRKPLDMDANTLFLGAKARTGTIGDEISPEISGLYSWKNDSETFGVLVAGAFEDSDYVRRGTEADYQWSQDVEPSTFVQERERTALDANIQFAPTEALSFNLHVLSLDLTADNIGTNLYYFPPSASTYSCEQVNAAGVCVIQTVDQAIRGDLQPGWASGAPDSETFMQHWGRVAEMTSDTYDFSAEYAGDGFTLSGSIGQTEAKGGTNMTTNFQYFPSTGSPMSLWAGTIDATGKQIKIHTTHDPSMTLDDLQEYTVPQAWAVGKGPNTDEETYAQVDVEFDLDWGIFTSFKTGIRTTDHDVERFDYNGNLTVTEVATASLYNGTYEVGVNGVTVPEPNLDAMIAATENNLNGWDEARPGYSLLNEQNDAFYGMFTFEGDRFKGNVGVRYISSDITRTQYELDGTELAEGDIGENNGYSYTTTDHQADYDDFLPSFNLSVDLTDSLLMRFTAAQTISRPNYADMVVSYSGYADDRDDNQTVNMGSEGLLPMKSSQADLSLEYYYGEGNLVSATYFVKSIDDFVTDVINPDQQIGVEDPAGGDNWTINEKVNASGADINGIELQINHGFDNGFGVSANYTYVNADAPAEAFADRIGVFTESSQDSANLVGYWENDTFSVRTAYNWRSKYMIREGGFYYGNRMHDDFGSLDFSANWYLNDNIDLSFEATNLLAEDDIQYGAADESTREFGMKAPLLEGYPAWSYEGETRYMLGVSFKL